MRDSPFRSLALAAFLTATSAHAASGVAPNDATAVQREEAQSLFTRGRDLYSAKKFDEAADLFEKSYAIVASPNALFFLARCHREQGKLVAAYAELGRTAAEAREHASEDPRYAKTADAATEERNAITPQLGFVIISVTGGSSDTTVTVGGTKFPRAALGEPFPVMPGSTEIILDTPSASPLRQTVAVFGGEKKTVTFDATQAAQPSATGDAAPPTAPPPLHVPTPEEEAASRDRLRTWSYASGGVAVAGLVTFAVAGLLSNATYNDLQSKCHGPCGSGSGNQDEINRGNTEQTVADVGLVVGLVGATAAVALFVMSLPPKSDKVSVVVGPTWVGVKGEF